jgi:WD40 repeat protein
MASEERNQWGPTIAYFPDEQKMLSGSSDKTARLWDLRAGKEIEGTRVVCEQEVNAVAVSSDGRWAVTAGGEVYPHDIPGKLKVYEMKTGIVKRFEGHSRGITCIDISIDSKLLASGSRDGTARTWSLDTGELVAGPFDTVDCAGAVRFSMIRGSLQCIQCSYGKPEHRARFSQHFWSRALKRLQTP